MTTKKNLTTEDRRNISLVKMELVKMAHVNIKNIFPALGMDYTKAPKSGSYTKKGSGRKHLQGKQL
jgi:hypothetical protein